MEAPLESPFGDELLNIAASLIEPLLPPEESLDTFLKGAVYLAVKRARLLGRDRPKSLDLLYMISLMGLCRFEPPGTAELEEQLKRVRQGIFPGAAEGNMERLEAAVPEATLLLSFDALDALRAQGSIEGFLRM